LKVPSEEVPGRVATLVERLRVAEKELDRMRLSAARAGAANAVAAAEVVGKVRLVAQRMSDGMTAADLRSLVGDIRGRLGSDPAVVVLISEVVEVKDDNQGVAVPFVVAANDAAVDAGVRAGDLVRGIAEAVGGRGGGKADLAQGSGSDPGGIDAALAWVRAELARN
jgi:alanyl-tRNA synthetase